MSNIAQAFKAEITRISKKETKAMVGPVHKSNVALKKTVADLKKRIAVLEADNKRLLSSYNKTQAPSVKPEDIEKVRITSKGIRTLRAKLGLTRDSFARLLGVSSQAVYSIESKNGPAKLRRATLLNFLAVRGMGKREVKKKLEEMKEEKN